MLLDKFGKPISGETLTKEYNYGFASQMWVESGYGTLTPQTAKQILDNALNGFLYDYLSWCIEIEDRDPHYRALLNLRKLAVSGLNVNVKAATDKRKDIKLADHIRDMVTSPEFDKLIYGMLDAIAKPFSVHEIIWDQKSEEFWIPRFEFRDPRLFTVDTTGYRIMIDGAGLPRELPEFKFVVHIHEYGKQIARCGLTRAAMRFFAYKSFVLQTWLSFVEKYGMPIQIGRYAPSATEQEINDLWTSIRSMGTMARAVLPDNMAIDFQHISNVAGSADLYQGIYDTLNLQMSKLVLGQPRSMDEHAQGLARSSESNNRTDSVRLDLMQSDAKMIVSTLTRDVIIPYIRLNFGNVPIPKIEITIPDNYDLVNLTTMLKELVPLGLEVEQSVIRDLWGLPDPDVESKILSASTSVKITP